MEIRPESLDRRSRYGLLISALVPRPIAWISTVAGNGARNLAPFSFFGGIATTPPLVGVSIGRRRGEKKDTLRNLEETGEAVIHIPTVELADRMVLSSGDYPPRVDEFELTGLTPVPSVVVRAARIAEAPLAMECRVERIIELGADPEGFVIARILLIHVRDEILEDGRIRVDLLHPIGRLGGSEYCFVERTVSIPRPDAGAVPERHPTRVQSSGISKRHEGESSTGDMEGP